MVISASHPKLAKPPSRPLWKSLMLIGRSSSATRGPTTQNTPPVWPWGALLDAAKKTGNSGRTWPSFPMSTPPGLADLAYRHCVHSNLIQDVTTPAAVLAVHSGPSASSSPHPTLMFWQEMSRVPPDGTGFTCPAGGTIGLPRPSQTVRGLPVLFSYDRTPVNLHPVHLHVAGWQ